MKGSENMMNKESEEILTVNTLSEAISENDEYIRYIYSKLAKSQDDIKNGRVMTIEESKERMRKKYANFNVK